MSDAANFDITIGGVFMPFLIAMVNQAHWSPKLRGAVAFVLCLGAAAVLAAIHGTFTLTHWRDTAVLVTGAAMVMYHALWKPSGLAPAVEGATTIGGDPPVAQPPAQPQGDPIVALRAAEPVAVEITQQAPVQPS
jgi:hypothetical protein